MPTHSFLQISGGIQLSALVDTGSMTSILSQKAFQQIIQQIPPRDMVTPLNKSISNSCVPATGKPLNSLGTSFVKMSFPNSSDCYQDEFLICDNVLHPLQCILGWDFFVSNQLQLTFLKIFIT